MAKWSCICRIIVALVCGWVLVGGVVTVTETSTDGKAFPRELRSMSVYVHLKSRYGILRGGVIGFDDWRSCGGVRGALY